MLDPGGALKTWPALLICCVTLAVQGCGPRLGDTQADLALEDLAAGARPSRLKQSTPTPFREALSYRVEGRRYRGDIYRSPQGSVGGIVLVPGVVPDGKDDARLVALANTLARLRFTVLVPDLPGLRRYQVRRTDVRAVADAYRKLISLDDALPQANSGIAGISYGAGPVVLAGLEPDIRERLGFVITLGGYHDLHSVVTFFTTGRYRHEDSGEWQRKQVSPYAAWVFALSNLELLDRPADRRRLRDYLHALADGEQAGDALLGLAPDAQALVELLRNRDPARVPGLIAALSPRIREELAGINPASHALGRLRAKVILVHGRDDSIIPYTESVALARSLREQRSPAHVSLFLIDGFAHVDAAIGRRDIPRLRGAVQLLLEQRLAPRP